jgi:hypothetical protein
VIVKKPNYRIFILVLLFIACKPPKIQVDLTEVSDPDIVLVNIGDGDRASIADLIIRVNNCRPAAVGLYVAILGRRDSLQDLYLSYALEETPNDVMGYLVNGNSVQYPDSLFTSQVTDMGVMGFDKIGRISSHTMPVKRISEFDHEIFAMKLLSLWKPERYKSIKDSIPKSKPFPIYFQRTVNEYHVIHGDSLSVEDHFMDLFEKVVILGYLGPSPEDKHFTPIRFVNYTPRDEPDTYGTVIVANTLRQLHDQIETW